MSNRLTFEEIYEAYTDSGDKMDEVRETLDELEDEVSSLIATFDEIRDQFEQCRHIFRQFNRRLNPRSLYWKDNRPDLQLEKEPVELAYFMPKEKETE